MRSNLSSGFSRRNFLKTSGTLGAIGLTGLSGCLGSITGGSTPEIGVAYIVPVVDMGSVWDVPGLREEFAEHEGSAYELSVIRGQSTPSIISSIAAGEVDFGNTAYASFPRAVIDDVVPNGLTGVAANVNNAAEGKFAYTVRVRADSDIESVADLEGMTVGVNGIGTGVQAIIAKALTDAGMDYEADVQWTEVPFPAHLEALKEERIDAGIFVPAFDAQARADGTTRPLFTDREAWGDVITEDGYPFVFISGANDTLENETAASEAFLEDYVSAIQYMNDPANRDTIIAEYSSAYDIPEAAIDSYFQTEHDVYHPNDGQFSVETLQGLIEGLAEMGFLSEAITAADHVDFSYLP